MNLVVIRNILKNYIVPLNLTFSFCNFQQKELIVAYKPIIELLSFYYSSEFQTLKTFVPDITYVFDQHKSM